MSKHTPGPWSWHGVELLSPGYFVLACTQHGRPERRDASLIAAAPELLEALIAARDESYIPHAKPWLLEKINTAIAKATGEQP